MEELYTLTVCVFILKSQVCFFNLVAHTFFGSEHLSSLLVLADKLAVISHNNPFLCTFK